jgi:hypothetical protein
LPASKITSGVLSIDRIPVMDDAHIPNLETLSYGGPFAAAQIPNLDASKITSGVFAAARVAPDVLTTQGDILIRGAAGYERLGAGTSGQFLKTQGAGANPVWAAGGVGDVQGKMILKGVVSVYKDNTGTTIFIANDAEKSVLNVTVYTKLKEIKLVQTPDAALKIYFELKSSNVAYTAYAQIYRNGVAVGTERSTTSTTYVAFTETVSGWADGDLLQIYAHTSGSGAAVYVHYLRVLAAVKDISVDYSINQDP